MEFKVKAVLFDFWDTLFHHFMESHPVDLVKELTVGEKMNWKEFIPLIEETLSLKDFGENEIDFSEFFKRINLKPSRELKKKLKKIWIEGAIKSAPYKDVLPVLKELKRKGFKLALISNTTSYKMRFLLKKSGFSKLFDVISLSCWLHLLKPSPEIFQKTLQELSVSSNEAVMVGNSIASDIMGAKKAGIQTILLDRNHKFNDVKQTPANALIHSLNELLELLELKK